MSHLPFAAEQRSLSSAALRLHVCAVLASIYEQRPGLVTDAYLLCIPDPLNSLLVELCASGMWSQRADGYAIAEREVLRIAHVVHEQAQGYPPDR